MVTKVKPPKPAPDPKSRGAAPTARIDTEALKKEQEKISAQTRVGQPDTKKLADTLKGKVKNSKLWKIGGVVIGIILAIVAIKKFS